MTEPAIIVAGDSVTWSKTLSGYPASTWTLQYFAVTAESQIKIAAIADGDNFQVNLDAATTNDFEPGRYRWQAKVRKGLEVHTVDIGEWTIERNIALDESGYDARSHAQIIVDELEQIYEKYLKGFGFVTNYSIGDSVFTFRTAEDVHILLSRARDDLAKEQDRNRIALGKSGRPKIKIVM